MGTLGLLKTECDEKLAKAQQEIDNLTCETKQLTRHMKMQQAELDAYTENPPSRRARLLLIECVGILAENNWRGDLRDSIKDFLSPSNK